MTYDATLAVRIRELLTPESNVAEKSIFGGLAFLINGNMAVAASGQGGLMVRVAPDQTDALLQYPHTEAVVMSGRPARGWLRVSDDGVRTDRQLQRWVTLGSDYARKLPAK